MLWKGRKEQGLESERWWCRGSSCGSLWVVVKVEVVCWCDCGLDDVVKVDWSTLD